MQNYDHKKIEKKWQADWEKKKIYQAKNNSKKKKYYSLIEFPYPSGAGLHVGHVRSNTAMDIVSRKRRMEGFNVLYPMGWDAFGLPTENYAIKTGIQPQKVTKQNTDTFRKQLKSFGFSFDWDREINTTDPTYYKWTQWIFLQMFKKGLAYKHKSTINWCPSCKIGLANEEAQGGICERCGSETVKKEKEQWMLAITKYADRLDKDLDLVDYPERIKAQQRNWIGRSEGSEIEFKIKNNFNFLIIHAFKSTPEDTFYPWLKSELEKRGYQVQVPHLSNPAEEKWVDAVLKQCKIDENTVIIGHSLGAVTAMKVVERLNKKVAGLVLAGGFIVPKFKDKHRSLEKTFTWNFDFGKIKKNTGFIKILSAKNDYAVPFEQGKVLHKKLGGDLFEVNATGSHFCGKQKPAILDVVLDKIKVFTTRADTLFGATYVVLAPEHELVQKLNIENKKEVEEYIKKIKNKTEIERTDEKKEKTGIELKGVKAINPANNEEIPVWIADYVLAGYGTGAVMAVPAHDERDFEFAKKYNLPMNRVVEPKFFIKDGDAAFHDDEPIIHRECICAIVRNPKNDKYLCISWKDHHMHGLVTGGIDEGEDILETAKREIYEETGYKNIKLVKDPKFALHTFFWHRVKKCNRHARFWYLFFDLENEECDLINEKESKLHNIVWLSKEEIKNYFTVAEGEFTCNFIDNPDYIFTEDGILNGSGKFNDLNSDEARKKITEFVGGKIVTKYKLRDWIFSRQRYWGEPIPLIHCEKCGWVPVPERDLPVLLPVVKSYKPTDTGESPLSVISKWVNTKCPKCKGKAKRETDTMPNWAGSSWYYLRYTDPKNKKEFANKKILKYWTPVDWYNGGMEHVTLHLLYSRFWHKFLYDLKLVPSKEPYKKRTAHGMILASNGEKMSKSRGNVINPDDIIKLYGADTLRIYEMFIGPFADTVAWNDESIIGPRRFIEKVWRIGEKIATQSKNLRGPRKGVSQTVTNSSPASLVKLLHKTIKKVGEDIEEMHFNTAVSAMMILATELEKAENINIKDFKNFLQILAPFAPHVAEELWINLGEKKSINFSAWPKYNKNLIKDDEVKIAIQVNGKVRAEIMIQVDETEDKIKEEALKNEQVLKFTNSKEIKKVIYVKNRLVNIVV